MSKSPIRACTIATLRRLSAYTTATLRRFESESFKPLIKLIKLWYEFFYRVILTSVPVLLRCLRNQAVDGYRIIQINKRFNNRIKKIIVVIKKSDSLAILIKLVIKINTR